LLEPRQALDEAGAQTQVASQVDGKLKAGITQAGATEGPSTRRLNSVDPSSYDALLLPGGVMTADTVRMNPDAVRFAKHFFDAGKTVAAICQRP
jgi:protease I